MKNMIRTVCGDIPAETLGITYAHEHLLTAPPASVTNLDFALTSETAALQELRHLHTAGGRAVVEMSPRDYGRNPEGLQRLSRESGIHIICVTGWLKEAISHPFVAERSIDDLAGEMISDIEQGIGESGVRAGVIKASSSLNRITALEEKVFRAAARAHHQTGAPISTHTEAGTIGLEQVALLRSEGVPADRIIIGHADRKMEYDYHCALLETGVTIGYDQVGKEKYYPDKLRIEFLLRHINAGFGKQLLISGDMARSSNWPSYGNWGGPGLTYILWRFVPWMHQEGLSSEAIEQLLVQNPARAFSVTQ